MFRDCFGVEYERIPIRGNGFCGYNSLSYCLTGSQEHYASIIEDCCSVFGNYPELLYQRTNFGQTRQSPDAASQYYWSMRTAIRRVQSGETLNGERDQVWWLDEAHLIAISLLYDVTIFSYSTVLKTWLAFNETGANGYICLLNSANHIEVLHGTCDSSGRRQPPIVPRAFESQRVSRASLNWSETVYSSMQTEYSRTFVWLRPQDASDRGLAERESTEQTDHQMQDAVLPQQGYYCDVAGCQFGPVDSVQSVKMHKVRRHNKRSTAAKPAIVSPRATGKQAHYCDVENCRYGPVWNQRAINMHKTKCHQNTQKEKTSDLHQVTSGNTDTLLQGEESATSLRESAKTATMVQHLSSLPDKTMQQCHDCQRFFVNLEKHKRCQKKAPEVTPMSPRKNKKPLERRVSNKETCSTDQVHTTSKTADDHTTRHHIRTRGKTRKAYLDENYIQELDRLKKDLQKASRKNSTQRDPLYDRLKRYHDSLRQ